MLDGTIRIVCAIVLMVVYLFLGSIISAPYTFLADGNVDHFIFGAMVAPIVCLLLFIFTIFGLLPIPKRFNRRKRTIMPRAVFWGFLGYCCLPIILNGMSIFAKWLGYSAIGYYLFEFRYISVIFVIWALILLFLILAFFQMLWKKGRRIFRRELPMGPSSGEPGQQVLSGQVS